MDRLFVAFKPKEISSNAYLSQLKRKYGEKKAGFSGTLDPFASGALVVAFGAYTRLFRFLQKSPKIYRATIWLGAKSESGDNRNFVSIDEILPLNLDEICAQMAKLSGEIEFIPPKFSAKRIDGVRAYKMAARGEEFEIKPAKMQVFNTQILSYTHPFLTIEISLSEGGYVRSFAEILGQNLGVNATLSALERISEGDFKFEDERALNPLDFFTLRENFYRGDLSDFENGKKMKKGDFALQENGEYYVKFGENFAVLRFEDEKISYLLNKAKL